jgi:hypothetical protein
MEAELSITGALALEIFPSLFRASHRQSPRGRGIVKEYMPGPWTGQSRDPVTSSFSRPTPSTPEPPPHLIAGGRRFKLCKNAVAYSMSLGPPFLRMQRIQNPPATRARSTHTVGAGTVRLGPALITDMVDSPITDMA